jgi:8-oxo-dGTP diphosphatase
VTTVDTPIARDNRGNELLAFIPGEETDLESLEQELHCAFSLVLLWHHGRCLLVFDRWKQAWELPGGAREDGESPRAAALRELAEETGERPPSLEYLGVTRIRLASDGREELGAIYQARTDRPQQFEPNDEIEKVTWWNPAETIADADAPDIALIRIAGERTN